MTTIIVLLILAGITINMILSNEGIMKKAQDAEEKSNIATDKETIKLKIVEWQMEGYTENKEFPNLQYIADRIAEDDDFDYLVLGNKVSDATKRKITLTDEYNSIFTRLSGSSYMFEIDRSIKIASIDGVKVESTKPIETFEKQLLEYPIVTKDGVCNVKCISSLVSTNDKYVYDFSMGNTTATDSLPIAGYDNNLNTDAEILSSVDKGWMDVDKSAIGKKIIFKNARNCCILNDSSSGKTLASTGSTTGVDLSFTIPENTTRLYFTTYARRLGNLYFSEIIVEN